VNGLFNHPAQLYAKPMLPMILCGKKTIGFAETQIRTDLIEPRRHIGHTNFT
jgi:hypothetical protein